MNRRKFIASSCNLCVAAGAGLMINSLSSCSPLNNYQATIVENTITVPLALFDKSATHIINPVNYRYNIMLKKESEGNFKALLLKCTHAENPVNISGNGFDCYLHGSKFDNQGNVLKGPASSPLKILNTQLVADQIIITLI